MTGPVNDHAGPHPPPGRTPALNPSPGGPTVAADLRQPTIPANGRCPHLDPLRRSTAPDTPPALLIGGSGQLRGELAALPRIGITVYRPATIPSLAEWRAAPLILVTPDAVGKCAGLPLRLGVILLVDADRAPVNYATDIARLRAQAAQLGDARILVWPNCAGHLAELLHATPRRAPRPGRADPRQTPTTRYRQPAVRDPQEH